MARTKRAGCVLVLGLVWFWTGACGSSSGSFTVPDLRLLFADEFDDQTLDESWLVNAVSDESISLTDKSGFLRLSATNGVINQLTQNVSGDFFLQTKLEFEPSADRQLAGLLIEGRDGRTVTFGLISARFPRGTFRGLSGVAEQAGGRDAETAFEAFEGDEVYLLIERRGNVFSLAYSRDGREFTRLADLTANLSDRVKAGLGNVVRDNCESRCNDPRPAFFDFVELSRPK